MTETVLPSEVTALSFEDALRELESIVQSLERGQIPLDEAVSAYERGTLLKRHCEHRLSEASAKIEKITVTDNGVAAGTTPFQATQSI